MKEQLERIGKGKGARLDLDKEKAIERFLFYIKIRNYEKNKQKKRIVDWKCAS